MRSLASVGWVLAACYAPHPAPGAPCSGIDDCPRPLECALATRTCEYPNTSAPVDAPDDAAIDARRIDGCAPSLEICGDGIDQDCDGSDPPCAANDKPAGAIDITAGGTFSGDLLLARDDISAPGCGDAGGRDLFYRIVLAAPQVYYLDTFNSSFDSVVRVYPGACPAVGDATVARACQDDACGGKQSQLALSLPAGESCIVIDQQAAAETTGALALHVIKGGRDGLPLARGAQTYTGDTSNAANTTEPVDMNCDGPGSGGKDHGYFFTTCPNETLALDAETCNDTRFDSVLYVKRVDGAQVGCNDDACGDDARIENVPIANGRLFWLYIDGFAPNESGAYKVVTNLR